MQPLGVAAGNFASLLFPTAGLHFRTGQAPESVPVSGARRDAKPWKWKGLDCGTQNAFMEISHALQLAGPPATRATTMKARRGKSRPGTRVFIRARPAVNGRKDALKRTRADVPPPEK
jgi:hypothetical protein